MYMPGSPGNQIPKLQERGHQVLFVLIPKKRVGPIACNVMQNRSGFCGIGTPEYYDVQVRTIALSALSPRY